MNSELVIDKIKTKNNVESCFNAYRENKQLLKFFKEGQDEIILRGNLYTKKDLEDFCNQVDIIIELLEKTKKDLLKIKYLDSELIKDIYVYTKVALSERHYYRIKWLAIKEFAELFNLLETEDKP